MTSKISRFSADLCDWQNTHEPTAKKHLGGKGAALVKMALAGLNVPPGFTIWTDVCNELTACTDPDAYDSKFAAMFAKVQEHMGWLTEKFGYTPLVSVRSGAPVSMPGMMDTILNVGLTDDNFEEWAERLGRRAALDSFRRLIQMLGSTAYGVPHEVFEFQLAAAKKLYGVKDDTELTEEMLDNVQVRYLNAFKENRGFDFPTNDANEQLRAAIKAVFDSWMNDRAVEYRKLNKIDPAMGTAVNVQAMVFGNMGDDSGTGVLFTRDPSTGADTIMGEFLQNAQGEDVVAGIRTPRPLHEMAELGSNWPSIHTEIYELCQKLEAMYLDMVDVEFTVQQSELFILQSRVGKRSARAAFKIACDLVDLTWIDRDDALGRIKREQFKVMRRPMLDPEFKLAPDVVGLPACPGVVSGKPVFSSEDAVNCSEPCILVTHETTPDDIKGMAAAVGILTQTGGATSHAAVVARAMDKTCVVGCTALDINVAKLSKKVTIDGSTGNVWFDIDVPVIDSSEDPYLKQVVDWAFEKLNAFEGVPVDMGEHYRHHAVQAAHWWGNATVSEAVLDGLVKLCEQIDPFHVILDLRSPRSLMQPIDNGLLSCFGQSEPDFWDTLRQQLIERAHKLAEMRLVLPDTLPDADTLLEAGYGTVSDPLILPADYAAFSVLAE